MWWTYSSWSGRGGGRVFANEIDPAMRTFAAWLRGGYGRGGNDVSAEVLGTGGALFGAGVGGGGASACGGAG